MSRGIYQYTDLETDEVVYIGKDSNIHRNQRHNCHIAPSAYDDQPFNRVLQNNPERYEYSVVCEAEHYSDVYLNLLEKDLIKLFKPKFNFTKGGDGSTGYIHTNESKQKMSESKKGENHPWYGKSHSEKTLRKMSEAKNTSNYFRVSKIKDKTCKKGFIWRYRYFENGKRKEIKSTNIKNLEERVKAKGLEWWKLKQE